ncbi:MAG TPA: MFS transporter [Myxococcota bacterium]|jgi:nucleoside transporter|nr:MFS transporter [Myxococcota bacterium]
MSAAPAHAAAASRGPGAPLLRTRLSVMMFLQFATWGAWVPLLGNHLTRLHFSGPQISEVYGTGALATMLAPLVAGQIADRWFSTERFLAAANAAAAVLFWLAAAATRFEAVWGYAFAAMLCFAPTLGLANSLAMRNLPDPKHSFPRIRSFGTVGWIAAGMALTAWFAFFPARPLGDCLRAGAVFAAAHAAFALLLPGTPPMRDAPRRLAVGKALAMLRERSYAVFVALAFVLMCVLNFYYTFAGTFLEKGLHLAPAAVPAALAVGQLAEILTLMALPIVHRRLGTKATVAVGIAAWGLRYGAFVLGRPLALVLGFQALHGVCFGFVFVVAMLYVDRIAPPDARASAQSFLSFVTYGAGMFAGSFVAAWASRAAARPDGSLDFAALFRWPLLGSVAVLLVFLLAFRPRPEGDAVTAQAAPPPPPAAPATATG